MKPDITVSDIVIIYNVCQECEPRSAPKQLLQPQFVQIPPLTTQHSHICTHVFPQKRVPIRSEGHYLQLRVLFINSTAFMLETYTPTYRCSHCKERLVILTTEWLPWLQETLPLESSRVKLRLLLNLLSKIPSGIVNRKSCPSLVVMRSLLKANCINNLSPNHTLQLTTLRTSVKESSQTHFKVAVRHFHITR